MDEVSPGRLWRLFHRQCLRLRRRDCLPCQQLPERKSTESNHLDTRHLSGENYTSTLLGQVKWGQIKDVIRRDMVSRLYS